VISTSLYFIVFGAAIGSRITQIEGVSYGAFIVPGLIMLMLLTQSVTNASFGIYFPRFVGTIYEILSAPVSPFEIVLGYVGAAATKSIILGSIILATSAVRAAAHRASGLDAGVSGADRGELQPVRLHSRLWADGFEKLQIVPLLIITPLTFLGGTFYSTSVLAAVLAHRDAVQSAGLFDQRASAGAFSASPTSMSRLSVARRCLSSPSAWRSSGGSSRPATG
jgi:ABC-2 type transport system permease protein